MARDQLGRDVFARGEAEAVTRDVRVVQTASLVDLMRAYARIKTREDFTPLHLARGPVYTHGAGARADARAARHRDRLGASWRPGCRTEWRERAGAAPLGDRRELRRGAGAGEGRAAGAAPGSGAFQPIFLRQRAGGRAMNETAREFFAGGASRCRPAASRSAWSRRVLFASRGAADRPRDRRAAAAGLPTCAEALAGAARGATRGAACSSARVGEAWAFRTAADLGFLMSREVVETRKLCRAAIETLAIVAYHQPVTRAEIEEIRGVSVSGGTLDQLIELGWVRLGRRRMTPGRPMTFVVTQGFLDHFGLEIRARPAGDRRAARGGPARQPPGAGRRTGHREGRRGRGGAGKGVVLGGVPECAHDRGVRARAHIANLLSYKKSAILCGFNRFLTLAGGISARGSG